MGPLERHSDELPKKWSRPIGTTLELGMRLSGDPEGVVLELNELDQTPIRRFAGAHEA